MPSKIIKMENRQREHRHVLHLEKIKEGEDEEKPPK